MSPVQVRPLLLAQPPQSLQPDLPPGFPREFRADIRFGESNAEYHSDPRPSKSGIADFDAGGPLLYELRHIQRAAPLESPAVSYGSLLHTWAELGQQQFWDRTIPVPDEYLTASGAFSKKGVEWRSSLAPELIPLSAADRAKLTAQTSQLLRNSKARELLESIVAAEFSVRFTMGGHAIRCRPDLATPDVWADLKTTREQKPLERWRYAVREYRYAFQSAIYQHGAVEAGWPEHELVYIVTSTVPPYACHCVTLPPAAVAAARTRVLQILDEIAERAALNHWLPDDYGSVTELYMPAYAKEAIE